MLQEYEALRATIEVEGEYRVQGSSGEERALTVDVKDIVCWYCDKKGHRKSECRKRKADLRKKDRGRRRNHEHAHLAHVSVAAKVLVDSGASRHIVNDEKLLYEKRKDKETTIQTATHEVLRPKFVGKCAVGLGLSTEKVKLHDVLCVPGFSSNLLSVSQLCDDGYKVEFDVEKVLVKEHDKIVGMGRRKDNVYVMPLMKIEKAKTAKSNKAYANALELWHLRLGHADKNSITRMAVTENCARNRLDGEGS